MREKKKGGEDLGEKRVERLQMRTEVSKENIGKGRAKSGEKRRGKKRK